MLTTETLEEILRDLRYEFEHQPKLNKQILETLYYSKFELLEKLIEISKEANDECEYKGRNVCESRQNNPES